MMTIELTTKDIQKLSADQISPIAKETILNLETEIEQLRLELNQERQKVEALTELADQDPLVNIMNRRAFIREMTRIQASVARHQVEASFVYIDINNLKNINNNHGQAAGDAVLKNLAETLTMQMRQTDTVGRLGGDEFGLLLAHAPIENAEVKMLNMAREISEKSLLWHNCALSISITYGIFSITPELDAIEALENANAVLYERNQKNPW